MLGRLIMRDHYHVVYYPLLDRFEGHGFGKVRFDEAHYFLSEDHATQWAIAYADSPWMAVPVVGGKPFLNDSLIKFVTMGYR